MPFLPKVRSHPLEGTLRPVLQLWQHNQDMLPLTGTFIMALDQGDHTRAVELGEASLALWEELDDRQQLAVVLLHLGVTHENQGNYAQAYEYYQRSLALWQELGETRGVAHCLSWLAHLMCMTGHYEEAEPYFSQAHVLYEEQHNRSGIARSLIDQGLSAFLQGDIPRALDLLRQGLVLSEELRSNQDIPAAHCYLGSALLFTGAQEEALAHLTESLRLRRQSGDRLGIFHALLGIAAVVNRQGRPVRAAQICGAALALLDSIGGTLFPGVRALYERELATLRGQLDDTTFERAWAEGAAMSLGQAIAYVLGEDSKR